MNMLRNACLTLLLLSAPYSVVWGDEPGRVTPQIAKTASKVSMPAAKKEGSHAARVQKDKESVRKIVLAKKMQRQAAKKVDKSKKAVNKKMSKKPTHAAKRASTPAIPARLGIRTWSFPETASERSNKIAELNARIKEAENAYDAETGKLQKLQKQSNYQANPVAGAKGQTPAGTGEAAAAQRRLSELMSHLNELHRHRNEVSDLVFLKSVRD